MRRQSISSIRKRLQFCSKRSVDPVQTTVSAGLDFLTELVHSGAEYSSVNTARSALSALLWSHSDSEIKFGSHPLVTRFMRGVYNIRPQLPRYTQTWDVGILLRYLSNMEPLSSIPLKLSTYKLACLCALTTGQRAQSLAMLDLTNTMVLNNAVHVTIAGLTKTSRPGQRQPGIILSAYTRTTDPSAFFALYSNALGKQNLCVPRRTGCSSAMCLHTTKWGLRQFQSGFSVRVL